MDINDMDFEDTEVLEAWIASQRSIVLEYLQHENIPNGGIFDEPDFCLAPHIAIWPVLNSDDPETIGFWVISGDLPTDFVSSEIAEDPREVLRHFGNSWSEVAEHMAAGKPHPTINIAPPEEWPEIAPLLAERAEILLEIADDDEIWEACDCDECDCDCDCDCGDEDDDDDDFEDEDKDGDSAKNN